MQRVIVLSLVLVIVAAVALIAGFFQPESLTLIWVSIGACVTAMLFLGIGVLQRKRSTPATSGGYGPGAGNAPVRPSGSAAPSRPARERADQERSSEAPAERVPAERAEQLPAEREPAAPEPAKADTQDEETVIVRKASARKGAVKKKVVAKKAVATSEPATKKKATTEKAAKKAAKKAATKKAGTKKAGTKKAAKKATKRTTGAEARAVLSEVRGVGPAKQEALLARFGSIENIRSATQDEIATVKGIGPTLAAALKDELS